LTLWPLCICFSSNPIVLLILRPSLAISANISSIFVPSFALVSKYLKLCFFANFSASYWRIALYSVKSDLVPTKIFIALEIVLFYSTSLSQSSKFSNDYSSHRENAIMIPCES
jgi:hypothetical protein